MTTTLQVTNFNFYGDKLIALRDNSTGEIYTAINAGLEMNKCVIKEINRLKMHLFLKGC